MLRSRLIAAALIIIPLLTLIWLDDQYHGGRPGIWLGPLAAIIGVLGCLELNSLLRAGGHAVSAIPNLMGTGVVLLLSLAPLLWTEYPVEFPIGKMGWTLLGMAAAIAIIFISELATYQGPGQSVGRLSMGLFAVCYSGLLISFLIQLRFLYSARVGLLAVVVTILIVKLSDSGAYFTGRSWGRNKLAPRLSPGKTVEGVVGGVAAAAIAAWLVRAAVMPYFAPDAGWGPTAWFVIYGVTLALAGVLGDLSESLLKRDVGQKDSSDWLPGLGGILDITDSVIATAPVSFAWWASGLLVSTAPN